MYISSQGFRVNLDLITTNPWGPYTYQFAGAHIYDARQILGYGQEQYYNNLLEDCTIRNISMWEYLSPNPVSGQFPVSRPPGNMSNL